MNTWIKRILLTLGILIVLLLAAAVILPIVFKDKIEAAVKAQVNRSLNAEVDWGAWDISLLRSFPNITVEVNDVRVSNKAPFEGIDLARVGTFTATVNFWAVLGDRIQLKRIAIERPHIHVKVLADGTANYDIALPDSAMVEAPVDTSATAFDIALQEYLISDGRVVYDDATLPFLLELGGLQHRGSGDFTQDLFTLRTTTTADTVNVVFDGITYLKKARADIKADLEMDLPNMKFTFKDNEAAINQLVLGFDGWLAMPNDDIDMDITWNAKKTDFATLLSLVPAEFASDLSGVSMSGTAAFNGHVRGTYNDNSLPGFGVVVDVDNGRFQYPDLPAAVENIFVDLKLNSPGGADMDGLVVDLKRFAMSMAGNPVEARMHLTTPISDPSVDAELKANLDLASVKKVVPMEEDLKGNFTADVRMKGRMSDVDAGRYDKFTAEGRMILLGMEYRSDSIPVPVGINSLYFDFSPRFLSLTSFDGSMGSSSIQAKGRFDNYIQWWLKDSLLTGSFDLTANRFDLNELMGNRATTETAADSPADTTKLSVIEVPGNIDFSFNTRIGEVIYDNLNLTNVRGGLRVHDQRVDLKDVFFNLFGGSVTMAGGYETRDPKRPAIDFRYTVKDLDIEQTVTYMDMVQKMAPIARSCKGKFSTDLRMNARLDEHMEVDMNSLTGNGTLRTRNVRVDGFQPLVDLAKALKIQEIQNTSIQDILFTYRFEDGKMITDPFDVRIDRIQARVGGSTAFADHAIDYDMTAKIPTSMFGAAAAQTAGNLLGEANRFIGTNLKMPDHLDATIKITGKVEKPVIKPVFAGTAQGAKEAVVEQVKEVLNEEIAKRKEELIARARAERDRLIAEAQANADRMKADARREAANVKAQAYKAADDELAKVTNPLQRAAAKLVADKAKQEADRREQQFVAEADKRADGLVDAARRQGDELVRKAEETDTTVK
jgi:uncharacterized protein involved in outer membrane biogenesis/cell division septum initiation protein DivIVA